jgi:hypothetical protein
VTGLVTDGSTRLLGVVGDPIRERTATSWMVRALSPVCELEVTTSVDDGRWSSAPAVVDARSPSRLLARACARWPFDCARVGPGVIVADLVIHSGLTPLLASAQERGCYVQPGAVMSDHQVAEMTEFFGFGPGDWSPEAIARAINGSVALT